MISGRDAISTQFPLPPASLRAVGEGRGGGGREGLLFWNTPSPSSTHPNDSLRRAIQMTTCSELADYEWLTGDEAATVLADLVADTTPLHNAIAKLRS